MKRSFNRNRKRNKRNNRRRRPKRRTYRVKKGPQFPSSPTTFISKAPGFYMPDCYQVELIFNDSTLSRNNATHLSASWRYRSSAYDPDPAFSTGAIPGFAEFANFYANYRVLSMQVNAQIINLESFPITFGCWPTTGDPGTNVTYTTLIDYFVNPKSKSSLVDTAISGHSFCKIARRYSLSEVTGSDMYKYDDNYFSSTGGNPTYFLYIGIGFYSANGSSNLVNGAVTRIQVRYNVLFFGRKNLTTYSLLKDYFDDQYRNNQESSDSLQTYDI